MKLYLLLFISLLGSITCYSQQDPLYSQYINNPFVLNPAYAGLTNNLTASVSYRQQWSGLEGSPKTLNANGHVSLLNNKMGAGLMLVSDKIGSTSINEVYASGSYRVALTPDKILAFGLQAGFANYQIDNGKVNPYDPSDPLFQGTLSETKPALGAGVILKSDALFVGFSVPRLLKTKLQNGGVQTTLYSQHFYGMGSYIFVISEHFRFKPSVLLKMVAHTPLSVDLNASLILYENYSAGLLTRNFNTYGLFLQTQLKDLLRLGYVLELPTGKSVGAHFTTHEITLGIRMSTFGFHSNYSTFNF